MSRQLPTFSVIIPTRDRPQQLAVCLESLARQDYPHDQFEVIVVDDATWQRGEQLLFQLCYYCGKYSTPPATFGSGSIKARATCHSVIAILGDLEAFQDPDFSLKLPRESAGRLRNFLAKSTLLRVSLLG